MHNNAAKSMKRIFYVSMILYFVLYSLRFFLWGLRNNSLEYSLNMSINNVTSRIFS